ncbi:MAG: exodeoxyribonuclease VII large subunit [Planctomycetes bacterium]|nr:exodeoxyribonuclease VII large subunit [Planctomycetota bacterium]
MEHGSIHDFTGDVTTDSPGVWTVGELNARIKGLLGDLGRVAVEGEVSGLKRPASGHLYFDLKDKTRGVESVVHCAIWRSQVARALKQPLEEGAKVVAHGRLDIYAPRGSYSLIVDRVEGRGIGALLEQLEKLKAKLAEDGWFDRSRPLPRLPRVVGVVTSRDGAAFQDVLRTRSLRWPLYPLRLAHTPVQGPGAAQSVAQAIADLDASGVDVIVVCRGGGSLEDLWAFNELPVARAIRAASVPVVSGVGHETDLTLCDLVADWRAHTPTDAAQHVIPERRAFEEALERQGQYLLDVIDRVLERRERELQRLAAVRVLRDPSWITGDRQLACERLGKRLVRAGADRVRRAGERLELSSSRLRGHAPSVQLERAAARLEQAGRRLVEPATRRLDALERRLALAARGLESTSPFAVLDRGYALTETAGGAVVRDAAQLAPGDVILTRFAKGAATSRVESTEAGTDDGAAEDAR